MGKPQPPDIALLVKAAVREALADAMPYFREAVREELRAALPAGRGPFDPADLSLLGAVGEAVISMPCFFVGDVLALSDTSPALRDALLAADVENTADLGAWCRRMVDVEVSGFVLRRHGPRAARGQAWTCRACA